MRGLSHVRSPNTWDKTTRNKHGNRVPLKPILNAHTGQSSALGMCAPDCLVLVFFRVVCYIDHEQIVKLKAPKTTQDIPISI